MGWGLAAARAPPTRVVACRSPLSAPCSLQHSICTAPVGQVAAVACITSSCRRPHRCHWATHQFCHLVAAMVVRLPHKATRAMAPHQAQSEAAPGCWRHADGPSPALSPNLCLAPTLPCPALCRWLPQLQRRRRCQRRRRRQLAALTSPLHPLSHTAHSTLSRLHLLAMFPRQHGLALSHCPTLGPTHTLWLASRRHPLELLCSRAVVWARGTLPPAHRHRILRRRQSRSQPLVQAFARMLAGSSLG